MGHARGESFEVGFDRSLKREFHGAKVSLGAGLLAFHDLDDAMRQGNSFEFYC